MREYELSLELEIDRLRRMRQLRDQVLIESEPDDPERCLWDALKEEVMQLGLPATRWQVALLRAYAPLICWRRLRRAMTDQERLRLIGLALRRERALMRRELVVLRSLVNGRRLPSRTT
jgi:hypothetical protein